MTSSGTRKPQSDRFALFISFAAAVFVVGVVGYLFWPKGLRW